MKILSSKDLSGILLQSNGKYEPDHWQYCLIKKDKKGYLCFDVNSFNVYFKEFSELIDGYEQIPPLQAFEDFEDFINSMQLAKERWIDADGQEAICSDCKDVSDKYNL